MSDVFVLGAGLSRAVSDHMPLLNELGREVGERLEPLLSPVDLRIPVEDFELWLSYLAGDQPWLNEPDQLRNRATFLSVSRVLFDVVREREHIARSQPIPPWLASLVARWHEDTATVITFNYDNLVEAAFTEVVTVKSRPDDDVNYVSHTQLYRSAISPIGSRAGAVLTGEPVETFTLLKLHGSRSWVYSGRSSFYGETMYDTGTTRGWSPDAHDPRPWLSEDKVPFIVPPTAGKTGFFDNETVRSEWRRAYASLRTATRMFIVGYSFPPTDSLVRFLVQQGLNLSAEIIVVNPERDVFSRVESMFGELLAGGRVRWLRGVEQLAAELLPSETKPVVILQA
jgi:hypothetical protein